MKTLPYYFQTTSLRNLLHLVFVDIALCTLAFLSIKINKALRIYQCLISFVPKTKKLKKSKKAVSKLVSTQITGRSCLSCTHVREFRGFNSNDERERQNWLQLSTSGFQWEGPKWVLILVPHLGVVVFSQFGPFPTWRCPQLWPISN